MTILDAVHEAAEAVAATRFHGTDGQAVRPCTPASVTYRHLRLLDVRPGMEVLEIGTGSGYSAALLAHLVGPTGSVTTVEISPKLSERARALYVEHGHPVNTVCADGLLGHPEGGPYDRIMVGTTPPSIPDAWLNQLAEGGRLLTGALLHELPGAYGIALVDASPPGFVITAHHGGYTPMNAPAPPRTGTQVHADAYELAALD